MNNEILLVLLLSVLTSATDTNLANNTNFLLLLLLALSNSNSSCGCTSNFPCNSCSSCGGRAFF